MSGRLITVLYEDQIAAQPTSYGPHMLTLACVADRIGGEAWELRSRVRGIAKKGNAKLRAALRDDGASLVNLGPLMGVFDDDRVRTCYGLPQTACKRVVLDTIHAEATCGLGIVLLQRNMEDVVAACCVALGHAVPAAKPTPIERDAILYRAVTASPAVRGQVLEAVPSFARLVQMISGFLAAFGVRGS